MEPTWQPPTHEELARFIARALAGDIDRKDWDRLIVNHYHDKAMEETRVQCVRLIAIKAGGDPHRLTSEDVRALSELAAALC
jgi:hypothetical protein